MVSFFRYFTVCITYQPLLVYNEIMEKNSNAQMTETDTLYLHTGNMKKAGYYSVGQIPMIFSMVNDRMTACTVVTVCAELCCTE